MHLLIYSQNATLHLLNILQKKEIHQVYGMLQKVFSLVSRPKETPEVRVARYLCISSSITGRVRFSLAAGQYHLVFSHCHSKGRCVLIKNDSNSLLCGHSFQTPASCSVW